MLRFRDWLIGVALLAFLALPAGAAEDADVAAE